MSLLPNNRQIVSPSKLDGPSLARALHKGEISDADIPNIPAQSIYLAIKLSGSELFIDIAPRLTVEQYRIILDLEFWQKDSFRDENFWDLLLILEQDESLESLQKIITVIDLKIIALMISRYTDCVFFTEQTDNPPGADYYTPDKGYTWIGIRTENPDYHRIMGKILALIFETSAELFYQLAAIPQVQTESMLEEESYLDAARRLSDDGFPTTNDAHKLCHPKDIKACASLHRDSLVIVTPTITPLITLSKPADLLYEFFTSLSSYEAKEEFEADLSFISNCALLKWDVRIDDVVEAQESIEKVRGALCIGIEVASAYFGIPISELYSRITLRDLFAVGLNELEKLRTLAKKINVEEAPVAQFIIESFLATPPVCPVNLLSYNIGSSISQDTVPFSSLKQVDLARKLVS